MDKVLAHKVPPQSIEAEEAVLGAIMMDNLALNKALELLRADDFYSPAHKKIFSGILDLDKKNAPCDLTTVTNILRENGDLEKVGGSTYLAKLLDGVSSAANVDYYAKIIKEKAVLRGLIGVSNAIIEKCFSGGADAGDVLDQSQHAIFSITETRDTNTLIHSKKTIKDALLIIETLMDRKEAVTGVPSGFEKLDEITAGFQNGDLVVIAARPTMGKTAFALDIARHVACRHKKTVAFFSLEMPKEQLAIRMLSADAGVDSQRIKKGLLNEDEWERVVESAGRISGAPFYTDDTPSVSVLEIKAKVRRLKSEERLDLLIVDYLQLIRGEMRREIREQEISEISRSLKALAKEINIPVLALAQLNRKVEDRTPRRGAGAGQAIYQLSDLRESGAIEQDADLIIFLHRPEVFNKTHKEDYDSSADPERGIAIITVEKHRNGPTGSCKLYFRSECTRFETTKDYSY